MEAATQQLPQHLQALARANSIRLGRAELKRQVHRGETPAAAVIVDVPDVAATMTAGELLRSQRRWGATRARKFLAEQGIAENKRLGTLTDRQRVAFASALHARTA